MPQPKAKGKAKFYVVVRGRTPGIYREWATCEREVRGHAGAVYKSFPSEDAAREFLRTGGKSSVPDDSLAAFKAGSGIKRGVADEIDLTPFKKARTGTDSRSARPRPRPPSPISKSKDKTEWLEVYTDGSCLGNGKRNPIAGVGVYFGPSDPRNCTERLPGPIQTNNRAELTAIIRALERTSRSENVRIWTDSQYSIGCLTKWWRGWVAKGWTGAKGKGVENVDLIKKALELLRRRGDGKIKFEYVRGHVGIHGNEMADQLAVNGSLHGSPISREPSLPPSRSPTPELGEVMPKIEVGAMRKSSETGEIEEEEFGDDMLELTEEDFRQLDEIAAEKGERGVGRGRGG
ncbi:hypothetical protein YB2330_000569 [Saitoella coloradoensis]